MKDKGERNDTYKTHLGGRYIISKRTLSSPGISFGTQSSKRWMDSAVSPSFRVMTAQSFPPVNVPVEVANPASSTCVQDAANLLEMVPPHALITETTKNILLLVIPHRVCATRKLSGHVLLGGHVVKTRGNSDAVGISQRQIQYVQRSVEALLLDLYHLPDCTAPEKGHAFVLRFQMSPWGYL